MKRKLMLFIIIVIFIIISGCVSNNPNPYKIPPLAPLSIRIINDTPNEINVSVNLTTQNGQFILNKTIHLKGWEYGEIKNITREVGEYYLNIFVDTNRSMRKAITYNEYWRDIYISIEKESIEIGQQVA